MKEDRCGDAIFVNAKRGAEKQGLKRKTEHNYLGAVKRLPPTIPVLRSIASQRLIGSWSFCRCVRVLHRYRKCQWFK